MEQTPWGPLGIITYARTYSRQKDNGLLETFEDTVERVIKSAREQLSVGFTPEEEEELRGYLLQLKGIVAGRFLWQMGTKTVDSLGLLSLQNCSFTTVNHPIRPFTWAMDALMLGSGVGYNIQREYVYELPKVKSATVTRLDKADADFIVPDSREGWVELLRRVLESHFYTGKGFTFSTECIRGAGTPIKGFGGVASGPEPLAWGILQISQVLQTRAGKKLRPIDALDVMNIIGYIVVAGNVRRSAQIALGDYDDLQYLNAKRWDLGNVPNWRAMSNNSVVCNDFSQLPTQFWEGYRGNGEPYGLINLRLAQAIGRKGETQYPDPEVAGVNPCVSGDTEILTDKGYRRIDALLDSPIDVWNGFEFSTVQPRITGYNQPMVTVTLSDGRSLRCTAAHKWVLADGSRISAKDLVSGQKLLKTSYPVIEEGEDFANAYTQGFYSAEGSSGKNELFIYPPKYKCLDRLESNGLTNLTFYKKGTDRGRGYFKALFDKDFVPFKASLKSRLEWFAGLLDGDGTVTKEGNLQLGSINLAFLQGTQKLLTTLGVASKISLMHEEQVRDIKGKEYLCQTSYRLMTSAVGTNKLFELGMRCERLDLSELNPNRDASRFTTIVSIVESGIEDVVYCFTEPKRNLGCFEGIVTGQCAEQTLAPYETCCLAETYLPNIKSLDEMKRVAYLLYRVNKHSLALKCHHPETEEIVHRNMRMGIGVTGYLQSSEEQKSWLPHVYEYLRQVDKEYSAQQGWPTSIKLTTVKPSGTLSLLAGVTSGCHPGYSKYYIRRIRIASNHSLVDACREHGFPVEYVQNFDGTHDHNTVVVEFPCESPEGTTLAKEVSAIDQLEVVKRLQTEWSDNAVSCTVYYKREELEGIQSYLRENYNDNFKSVSFLLHSEHGFKQAPLEEITQEEYETRRASSALITRLDSLSGWIELDDCEAGGHCPIR